MAARVVPVAGDIMRDGVGLELALHASAPGAGLRRFAHVSTTYVARTHRGSFAECDLARGQGFHNTYERSKWETERLVRRHEGLLPVQVFRPSIVVGEHPAAGPHPSTSSTPRFGPTPAAPCRPCRRGAPRRWTW